MITIYENPVNVRPLGANSIEIKLLICMAVKQFEFAIRQAPEGLDLRKYIIDFCATFMQVNNPEKFTTLIDVEIENSIKQSFIAPDGQLTPRGLWFVEMTNKGGYLYMPEKFEKLLQFFQMALAVPVENYWHKPLVAPPKKESVWGKLFNRNPKQKE